MAKAHVKKGETVVVIAGAHRGKRGPVLEVDRAKNRIVVEGVNRRTKTLRRSQENPQGDLIEIECPIHASNVMQEEKYDARRGGAAAPSADS